MAKNRAPLLLLLIGLFLAALTNAYFTEDLGLAPGDFPLVHAEKLIRQLNLFPEDELNVFDRRDGGDTSDGRIVERKLVFPNLVGVESGFPMKDLGHHAGYCKLRHSHDARMFYFFFESRGNKKGDPVVIWLTGVPGCGGELAMFYENGPFFITDNMTLVWNEYGWDKASNLIYVDQPVGSGFSYTTDWRDIRHDENGVSDDLYDFLQAFFKEHPEFAKNDFFIMGESYAGHYIPAFASRVHRGNKAKEGIRINLKGFAIGNGLTVPAVQYKAYTDYALDMGLINQAEYELINKIVPVCEMTIKLCGTDGTVSCIASYYVCEIIFDSIQAIAGDTNHFDIRKKCEGIPYLCYDFSNMEKFLNQKTVREALGVRDLNFSFCSSVISRAMLVDNMRNLEPGIPALLEDGIQLLVYAGEYDLTCNWLGNSRWVHAMEWSGQKKFAKSAEVPFEVDGREAGVLKSYRALSFLKVHDAGHMVPMDQPKASLEMLIRWMRGKLSQAGGDSGTVLPADM